MARRLTTEEFVAMARKVHGNKYRYPNTVYVNAKTPVEIECPKHGPFWQTPANHKNNGQGCPKCAIETIVKKQTLPFEEFVATARKVHGDKYVYDESTYVNTQTKMRMVCPEHGEFWQTPARHKNKGQGCPKCGAEKACATGKSQALTTEEFVAMARKVHGDKYRYPNIVYVNNNTPVEIECPKHGPFWQTPTSHKDRGRGCPKCGRESTIRKHIMTTEEFIRRARKVHGDKYIYDESVYVDSYTKVKVKCPEHGPFWQKMHVHTSMGCGCPKCANIGPSKPEQAIADWLRSLGLEVIQNFRGWCSDRPQLELDIYLPEFRVGIEYDGFYWHTVRHRDPKYHRQRKMLAAREAGIEPVFIQSWMWDDPRRRKVIARAVLNKLGFRQKPVYARKCRYVQVSPSEARKFHEANHVHGTVGATVHLGLKHGNRLVAVLSMIRKDKKGATWEMARYSTSDNVTGGFSKLWKRFVTTFSPEMVITYADARFWTGCGYRAGGFVVDELTAPGYVYVDEDGNFMGARQKFQKHKLKDVLDVFDPALTERQNCEMNGLLQDHDCGHYRWIWKRHTVR